MQDVEFISDHVVIGTPGTLQNLIRKRLLDMSRIRTCVIDEADEMIKQANDTITFTIRVGC